MRKADLRKFVSGENRPFFSLFHTDESHLLLQSPLTVEDIESHGFKVHDPCVSWLNGQYPMTPVRELVEWSVSQGRWVEWMTTSGALSCVLIGGNRLTAKTLWCDLPICICATH